MELFYFHIILGRPGSVCPGLPAWWHLFLALELRFGGTCLARLLLPWTAP